MSFPKMASPIFSPSMVSRPGMPSAPVPTSKLSAVKPPVQQDTSAGLAGLPGLTGQQSPLQGGDLSSALGQLLSMIVTLLQAVLSQFTGGGQQSGQPPASGADASGGGSSVPGSSDTGANQPYAAAPGQPYTPKQGAGSGQGAPDANKVTHPDSNNPPSSPPNGSPAVIGNDSGWNKNVNVFASSQSNEESWGSADSGYLPELEKGMDKGETLTQAHDGVHLNTQTPIRNNANPNSLVKGKGGNAVVVTGDNISPAEGQKFADTLKRDYGMNVQVIPDSSPKQLQAAIQKMGQQKGQQAMVAVLAHGAKDDSGKNNGMMALGKNDGDQWLSEGNLKSMVNQYLAPNYSNVNVVVSSCFAGNFVQ